MWFASILLGIRIAKFAAGNYLRRIDMTLSGSLAPSIRCPRCGTENNSDAVFCAMPACGKALGEFRYVREEVAAKRNLLGRISEETARWVGHPHFVSGHVLLFTIWVLINASVWPSIPAFDPFPYGLLGIILAVEAALITSLLLIAGNQRSDFDNVQAELQYEVSVKSHRLLESLSERLQQLDARISNLEQPPNA